MFNCVWSIVFLTSCSEEKIAFENSIGKTPTLIWTEGHYALRGEYGNYFENWEKSDSITYYGFGYFMDVENEDTLFRQRMKLHQTQDGIFMYFNVKNQNGNKDVEFKLTKFDNNIFTFENAFRDYPSIVTYKMLNDTSINVVMNGFKNGKEKREDFIITKKANM
jgi:hypothetical protein